MKTHRPGRSRRHLGTLAGLVSTALVLSACGGGASGDSAGSDTFTMAAATNVQTFDPQMAAVAQEYYLNPVFDTLVHAEPDGSFEPGLAESWKVVDPRTFELTVRSDVEFSDGNPVDADAVVANFERGIAMAASPSLAFYANIESVEAVDGMTVRLTLKAPTTDMLSQVSRLPGMMMSPASFDASPEAKPVGAGGWTYDAASSVAGDVQVYQANPDYWDPERVKVETVEIKVIEDASAATNAVLDGQVDLIELRGEGDRSALDNGTLQLVERTTPNVYYVQVMDTDGTLLEPMADERVRRALNLAIDRESFNKGVQFGNGDATAGFWPADSPYYDDSVEDVAYDPDEAKRLLAEAGYGDGFKVTFPSFGALTVVAESVQQMWAEIGVEVTIEQTEPGALATVMRNGKTAMTPTLARGFTAESQYAERFAPGSPYDVLDTDRGDLAELAQVALTAPDADAQDAGWRDVYTYLVEAGYLMVIGHETPTVVAGADVDGVELGPSDNLPKPFDITVD